MAASQRKAKEAPEQKEPENFEKALQELEGLVEQMEAGTLALDDLLVNYQRGAQLIAFCKNRLKSVEQQVSVFEKGELKPLKHDDEAL